MRTAIGIDVGGSSVRAALVAEDGRILASAQQPTGFYTPKEDLLGRFERVLADVMRTAADAGAQPEGAGIGMPGLQDAEGRVDSASNLPQLNGFDLRAEVSRITGVPAAMENDLNIVALGEYHFGGHKVAGNLLVVALGTGVGAAVIQSGEILRVARGCLGDPGHVLVEPGGRLCRCGARGCLEAHLSGWALLEQAREAGLDDPDLRPTLLFRLAREDNAAARGVIEHAADMLAMGLGSFAALYQPERVVLGGNVLDEASDLLLPRAATRYRLIAQPWLVELLPPAPPWPLSRIPQTAGVLGGAALVFWHFSTPAPAPR